MINIQLETKPNYPDIIQQPLQPSLLETIHRVKDRFLQQLTNQSLLNRVPTTPQQLQEKIRNLTLIVQMVSQQNKKLYQVHTRLQDKYSNNLEQLVLKEKVIQQHRKQLDYQRQKNIELANYNRKITNQYTVLLKSMKAKDQITSDIIEKEQKKRNGLQHQINFLKTVNKQLYQKASLEKKSGLIKNLNNIHSQNTPGKEKHYKRSLSSKILKKQTHKKRQEKKSLAYIVR